MNAHVVEDEVGGLEIAGWIESRGCICVHLSIYSLRRSESEAPTRPQPPWRGLCASSKVPCAPK